MLSFGKKPSPPISPAPESLSLRLLTAVLLLSASCMLLMAYRPEAVALPKWLRQRKGLASALAFAVNVVVVSIDGRFDGAEAAETMIFPWPTLFSPAGFAFAIWGIIYLGELAGVGICMKVDDAVLAQALSPSAEKAWVAANLAQCLWCVAFRPWSLERLWLSSALLATTAACLFASQRALYAESLVRSEATFFSYTGTLAWPRSLHLGWVTAATLVNLNAWAGYAAIGPSLAMAAAIVSVLVAAAIGAAYVYNGLDAAALAVAWALHATSAGTPVGADAASLGADALRGLALSEFAAALLLLGGLCLGRALRSRP